MAVRPIPEGSVEVQTGLWAYPKEFIYNGIDRSHYNVYSSEGYCFWEVSQPENYDEEGNLKPLEERVFAQYAVTPYTTIEEVNAAFVSVPAQDGYEIVSVGNGTVTA